MNQPTAGTADVVSTGIPPEPRDKHPQFQSCPICNGNSDIVFVKKGYPIRDCLSCGHRFAEIAHAKDHAEQIYADNYFNGLAGGYADYLADRELLISQGKRYASMLNRYMEPGNLLDVGAAAGFLLKGFEGIGWTAEGIEPNSGMATYARDHFGISIEAGTVEKSRLNRRYDLITMIQVIAHFTDPRQALAVASKLTKPGGHWLIETWNRNSLTARFFSEEWHEYNPPSVLHWFSIENLRELVRDFGLCEIAHGRPTKWISASHAKLIAQNGLGSNVVGKLIGGATKLIPMRLAIPYLGDDVFWALYRKPILE